MVDKLSEAVARGQPIGHHRSRLVRLVAASILVVLALILPGLLLSNLGMLDLRDAILMAPASATADYPPVAAVPPDSGRLVRAIARLQASLAFGPDRQATWWGLGRAHLAGGQMSASAQALTHLTPRVRQRPLQFADVLVAFSAGGHPEIAAAMAMTRTGAIRRSPRLGEAAAVGHIIAAESGHQSLADAARAILTVRPDDLWSNWVIHLDHIARRDGQKAAESRRVLATRAALPESPALVDKIVAVVPELRRAGIWGGEKTRHVAAWIAWRSLEPRVAARVLTRLRDAEPDEHLWSLYLGAVNRRAGDFEAAEAAYRIVLRTLPNDPDATLGLGLVAEARAAASGQDPQAFLAAAAEHYRSVLRVQPDSLRVMARWVAVCQRMALAPPVPVACGSGDSEGRSAELSWQTRWGKALTAARPSVAFTSTTGDGWTCIGVDADETALVRGEPSDLIVFWTGPEHVVPGTSANGWWQTAAGWLQVRRDVQSLLENGGFELGTVQERPKGFPFDIYVNDPSTKQLVLADRSGHTTTVGLLKNSDKDRLSSFISAYAPVSTHSVFLQAGWVRSIDANGYFGRSFYRRMDAIRYEAVDTYVERDIQNQAWRHLAGAVPALPGAQTIRVRFLNYFSTGSLLFDDTWLVGIDAPSGKSEAR